MEDTYKEALLDARIVDLQDNSLLPLPNTDELVALGLTVDDRLSFTIDGYYDDEDDLVLTLCHVQREDNGHWLIPSAFIPCILNEAGVNERSLLSPGSIIKVGDREMRYSLPVESRVKLSADVKLKDALPPKPRRTSLEPDQPLNTSRPMSTIVEEDEAKMVAQDAPIPAADEDLINHLGTSEEVAQLACSYVSHQVAIYTDLLLPAEELDFLFRSMLSCSESNINHLHIFVKMYSKEQGKGNLEIWPLHAPVIYLLTQLLNSTLDSTEMTALWIKLLATFANFSPNIPSFIQHKVAPVVMAAMAVHTITSNIQQYAATVLSQLATYTPPIGQKGPVREAGVDLALNAIRVHVHETLVLRPSLRTLANLTQTYSTVADEALCLGALQITPEEREVSSTIVIQEVERSMGILDYIEENALPVVMETMENNVRDVAIQTEGRRLLSFFVDDGNQVTRKKSFSKICSRKVRFQLDPNDPNSIVSTDSVIMDVRTLDIDELPPVKQYETITEEPSVVSSEEDESQDGFDDKGNDPSNMDKPAQKRKIGLALDLDDIKSELEVMYVDVDVSLDSEFPPKVENISDISPTKSLMDELAEIHEDLSSEENQVVNISDETMPECPSIDPVNDIAQNIDSSKGVATQEKIIEENDRMGVPEPERTDQDDEDSDSKVEEEEKKKGNSLKRGMAKVLLTGRAMDRAFKSGKNRMLNRMKKGLRFGDLRNREDEVVTEHKANAESLDLQVAETDDYQDQTEEILNSIVLAGVTMTSSNTDDVRETSSSHGITSEVSITEELDKRPSAPPLLIPTRDPEVKGLQNTVNNLIGLWKNKEKKPKINTGAEQDDESFPKPPPRSRKQWRPFENGCEDQTDARTITKPTDRPKRAIQDDSTPEEESKPTIDDVMTIDEEVEMRNSYDRRHRGSLAVIPDANSLLTARPSIIDSMELATWASSYLSVIGQDIDDIDPELEEEVRMNKTKWKSVVAEIKDRIGTNTMPVQKEKANISTNDENNSVQNPMGDSLLGKGIQESFRPYKPRPTIRKSITTYPTTDLNQEKYHELNLLAAKYLMIQSVLKTWHISPSLAAGLLEIPSGELLISVGASPSLISDIRPDIDLQKPVTEIYQIVSSKLMGILTSIPSADEIRLELLTEASDLLRTNNHSYHIQVGTESALCLLNYNMQDAITNMSGEEAIILGDMKNSLPMLKGESQQIRENIVKLQYMLDFLLDDSTDAAIFV